MPYPRGGGTDALACGVIERQGAHSMSTQRTLLSAWCRFVSNLTWGHTYKLEPCPLTTESWIRPLNPKPSTLNSQPSTLNTPPSTLNSQPSTLNPQPCTLNPQP